jgi:uncharacterized membrane protein
MSERCEPNDASEELAMTSYSITDLGTLQGRVPVPEAINEAGVVTGHTDFDVPFRYGNGALIELPRPSHTVAAAASGISSSQPERIAGWVSKGSTKRAALWTDGVYTDLGALTGGTLWEAWDVNDGGIVVGLMDGGAFHLDMTTQQVKKLVPPNSDGVLSCSINQSGHVAGCFAVSETQSTGLFLHDQTMHVIAVPGDIPWLVYVNDADVIASCYATQYVSHAFIYDFNSQVFTDIHDAAFPGGSIVRGINNDGVVVGSCMDTYDAPMQAMIWTASDGMRRLNDVVDMQSGWTFSNAEGINDAGQITGWGIHNGQARGFILTPVEEDSRQQPKDLVGMVQEILVGGGMGILLPSGDIIYPKDGGPVDPDSPLQRRDAARSDAAIGLAMHVLAQRISDRSTRALAEKAAVDIARSAAASAGSARVGAGGSNWLSRLLRDFADEVDR